MTRAQRSPVFGEVTLELSEDPELDSEFTEAGCVSVLLSDLELVSSDSFQSGGGESVSASG